MFQCPGQRIDAAAFRARRFPASPSHPVRISNGPALPANALPAVPVPTDSAAAPELRMAAARAVQALPPDPDYERRLEALAESMLGTRAPPDKTPASVAPPEIRTDTVDPLPQQSAAPASPPPPRRAADALLREPSLRELRQEPLDAADEPFRIEPELVATSRYHGCRVSRGDSTRRRPPATSETSIGPGLISIALFTGLSIGVAAAFWLSTSEDVAQVSRPQTAVIAGHSGTSGVTASHTPGARPSPSAGLQTDEPGVNDATTVIARPFAAAGAADAAGRELPRPPMASTGDPKTVGNANSDSASASQSASKTTSKPANPPPVAAVEAAPTRKLESGSASHAGQRSKRKADADGKTAKASRSAQKGSPPVRDDEISRLKSQAYSESSRDRTRRGASPAAGTRTPAGVSVKPISTGGNSDKRSAAVRRQLERCAAIDGLFRREVCKWDVCGDQWGKNGCPSFAKGENLY